MQNWTPIYDNLTQIALGVSALLGGALLFRKQVKEAGAVVKAQYKGVKKVFTSHTQVAALDGKVDGIVRKIDERFAKTDEQFEKTTKVLEKIDKKIEVTYERQAEWQWTEYELKGLAIWKTGDYHGKLGCVRASPAMYKLVGRSPLGSNWVNAIHPKDRDAVVADWNMSLETGSPYSRLQRFVHVDQGGKIVDIKYAYVSFQPRFEGGAGELTGGMGYAKELTKEEYEERQAR